MEKIGFPVTDNQKRYTVATPQAHALMVGVSLHTWDSQLISWTGNVHKSSVINDTWFVCVLGFLANA